MSRGRLFSHTPNNIDLHVLNSLFSRSENLISLAASSGDNEIQKNVFELILVCYANGNFNGKTRLEIGRYFKTVNFEMIDNMLLSCYDEKMNREQIKRVWWISSVPTQLKPK